MTGSFPLTRRIELLLRSASGAHYACRSLLDEACQELGAMPQLATIRDAVAKLLQSVEEGMDSAVFDAKLSVVIDALVALNKPPQSASSIALHS